MRSFLLGAPVDGAFNIPFKVENVDDMYREMYNSLIAILNGIVSGKTDPSTFDDEDTLVGKIRSSVENCEVALNGGDNV